MSEAGDTSIEIAHKIMRALDPRMACYVVNPWTTLKLEVVKEILSELFDY
jgi:hypothetical protein